MSRKSLKNISDFERMVINGNISLEYRKDTSVPNRVIEGWSEFGNAQTAASWAIRATDTVGSQTHCFFLNNNVKFDNKWSTRVTDLPALAYLNEFSIQFSGASNQYGTMADAADLDFDKLDDFSISFRWKSSSSGAYAVFQKALVTTGNTGYTLETDTSGRFSFQFRGSGSDNRINVRTDSFTSIFDGAWHNIIITKASGSSAASSVKIYIDGSEETLNVLDDTLTETTLNTDPLYFGSNRGGSARFKGNMDSLAIFNIELTSTSVTEIWNSNSGAIDLQTASANIKDNLVAWIRCGDGSFSALPTVPDEQGTNDMTMAAGILSGDIESEVAP